MNSYWGTETDLMELGSRFLAMSDEASPLEHRLCRANGESYQLRHWKWSG